MNNLLQEKTALEQTKLIISKIDGKALPKAMYRKLVSKIYDNQLKKFTTLNRAQRHARIKQLFKGNKDE